VLVGDPLGALPAKGAGSVAVVAISIGVVDVVAIPRGLIKGSCM
jgi:hypothetical protein